MRKSYLDMAKEDSGTASGLFGLDNLMKEFYGYQPKKDDDEGRALKNTFQAN